MFCFVCVCFEFGHHEETGVSAIFKKYGLRYDVPVSYMEAGSIQEFPYLKPMDMLNAMVATNDFKRLLGNKSINDSRHLLSTFWNRFKQLYGQHDVFTNDHTRCCLDRCLPLYIHGDEGQTYKKKGVLIVSFQSAFGVGGRHAPNQRPDTSSTNEAGIPLNFLRTALQSRYCSVVCPKDWL